MDAGLVAWREDIRGRLLDFHRCATRDTASRKRFREGLDERFGTECAREAQDNARATGALSIIFSYMDAASVLNARAACKQWHAVSKEDEHWKRAWIADRCHSRDQFQRFFLTVKDGQWSVFYAIVMIARVCANDVLEHAIAHSLGDDWFDELQIRLVVDRAGAL